MKTPKFALIGTLLLASVFALYPVRAKAQQQQQRHRRATPPEESPAPPKQEPEQQETAVEKHPLSIAAMGGLTFGSGSSYTVTNQAGTTTATDSTSSGGFFGGEADYSLLDYVALGLDVEWTKYNYQNTTITGDGETSVLAFPRLQLPLDGGFLIWGGVGLGLTVTSIGTTSGGTAAPIIVGTSSTTAGFTVAPRVGVDYNLTDQFFVGALFAYFNTRGSVSTPATATIVNNTSVSTQTTESFTRSWCELGVRIGLNF